MRLAMTIPASQVHGPISVSNRAAVLALKAGFVHRSQQFIAAAN
jgi:hypothetical protein